MNALKEFFVKTFAYALLFLLVGALAISFAAGTSATLTWNAPTTYSDASALPVTDIAFYTVSWNGGTVQVTSPALTTVVTVPCGSTAFSITVTTSATAKYPNATSAPDGPVPYATGIACVPNPPQGLAVH
jgi:hypothetical protein